MRRRTLRTMLVSAIAHAAFLVLLGNQGEPTAGVGPLAIGETLDDVRARLGPGIGTRDCTGGAPCDLILRYSDGASTAVVRFLGGRRISAIELHLGSRLAGSVRLDRRTGPIAGWTWAGGIAARLPEGAVRGWLRAEYAAGPNCRADYEIPDISAALRCGSGTDRVALFTLAEH